MKIKQIIRNGFFFATLLFVGGTESGNVWASAPAQGTLQAEQACEAYVSKNKQTNPDNTKLTIGYKYEIFEVNVEKQPTWYRIRVSQAQPPERWVAKHCGTIDVKIGNGGGSTTPDNCHTAGLEDSYVLALSWQPAFCETHRDKRECRIDQPTVYQARNFVLHGLWPNKTECGINYDYCGEVKTKPSEFCDYPPLELYTDVRGELEKVMPSAEAGSCLQRHEWFKHGTCQTHWSIDQYFEQAIDLTRQFNESGVGYFMARNLGKEVTEDAFFEKVDCALGEGAHERLQLNCQNGNLVDVYINLPTSIGQNQALGELVSQAKPNAKSSCGGRFRIDPIGYTN